MSGIGAHLPVSPNTTNFTGTLTALPVFGYCLIPIIVFGTLANTVVIISILRDKKLRHESINRLILSLCVADYIILLLDRPILTYIFLTVWMSDSQTPAHWCYAQTFFESFGMAALLLNLAILSFERYLTISRPLETVIKKRRIARFVGLSWVLSMACGIAATVTTTEGSYHFQVCYSAMWWVWGYFDYLVIPLGAVTTVFIAMMYALIMRMVRVHVSSTSNSLDATRKSLVKVPSVTLQPPLSLTRDTSTPLSALPRQPFPSPGIQVSLLVPPTAYEHAMPAVPNRSEPDKASIDYSGTSSMTKPPEAGNSTVAVQTPTKPSSNVVVEVFDPFGNKTVEKMRDVDQAVGAVCRFNPKNREAARRRMELATAKKSLAIVASFFLCWLPLPLCHLTFHGLVSLAKGTWWTFIPSLTLTLAAAINPVVYAFVNKQIRRSGQAFFANLSRGSKTLFRGKQTISSVH